MKKVVAAIALAIGLVAAGMLLADDPGRSCSIEQLAGSWVFATEVGRFVPLGSLGITAIGRVNIDRDGNVSGEFDNTIEGLGFFADNTFTGTATVDPNCLGTVSFETSAGDTRTDTIAVVGANEMWGMSQDPNVLWTYRAKRIPGQPRQ